MATKTLKKSSKTIAKKAVKKETKNAAKKVVKTAKKSSTSATKATKTTKTTTQKKTTSTKKTTSKKTADKSKTTKALSAKKNETVAANSGNIGMNMAKVISNTMGKYFSKFASIALVAIIGMSTLTGCTLLSGLSTDTKADIAYAAAKTATISWVALDENSTKYVDSLSKVVTITKEAVESYCSDTNTDFTVAFYDTCYAIIEKKIDELNMDELTAELSKSLAKFSVLECQKIIKLMKSETSEEAKEIVLHVISGIDSGLKVDISSTEYKVALTEQKAVSENEALKLKMTRLGAKKQK
jgi:hypothetical protein